MLSAGLFEDYNDGAGAYSSGGSDNEGLEYSFHNSVMNQARESEMNSNDNGNLDVEDVLSVAAELTSKGGSGGLKAKGPKTKNKMEVNLCHENGIPLLCKTFEGFRPKGKGHETHDLSTIIKAFDQWAHNLAPDLHLKLFCERVMAMKNNGNVLTKLDEMRDKYAPVTKKNNPLHLNDTDGSDNEIGIASAGEDIEAAGAGYDSDIYDEDMDIQNTMMSSSSGSDCNRVNNSNVNNVDVIDGDLMEKIRLNKQRALERKKNKSTAQ